MTIWYLHFIRPWWLLALIPLGLLSWLLYRHLKQADNWRTIIDPHLLPHLLLTSKGTNTLWPMVLLALAWCLSILALAGPSWFNVPQPVYRSDNAKVILLDLSPSMLANDLPPNRLTRAKYKILDILKNYPAGQTGMAVFSSGSYSVSPLTNDTHTIAAMVPVLSPRIMPVSGSNIGAGLKKAATLLIQGSTKHGMILVVTDSNATARDDAIARKIHDQGYSVSVLAVGTRDGAPIPSINGGFVTEYGKILISRLPIKHLEKLALAGGGRFSTFTNTDKDIHYLLAPTVTHSALTKAKKTNATTRLWRDEGHWFILLLLPLLLPGFRRGWQEEIVT